MAVPVCVSIANDETEGESEVESRRTKTALLLALLILSSVGGFALLKGLGSKESALSADAEIASAVVRPSPKATADPAPARGGLRTVSGNLVPTLDTPRSGKAHGLADVGVG